MDKLESKKYLIIGGIVILAIAVYFLLTTYKLAAPKAQEPAPNVSQELPKVTPSIAQALTPGQCPANQCRNWQFGSCSKKQLYKERECFRYGAFPDCPEETYYDSHTEAVDACGQSDCSAGKTYNNNYTCI